MKDIVGVLVVIAVGVVVGSFRVVYDVVRHLRANG
jgi:hypothetical protein